MEEGHNYLEAGSSVSTSRAECGNPDDEKMLVKRILAKKGGFTRLDEKIQKIREDILPKNIKKLLELNKERRSRADLCQNAKKANGNDRDSEEDLFFRDSSKTYSHSRPL